jgi:thiosulfate/3-mercaptopyruvate sulfurtransferase
MSRAGIGANTRVVAYDDRGGVSAGRLWWLLRYFGHENVALLDGGIAQWMAEGRALTTEIPQVARAEFTAQPHPAWVVNKQDILKLQNNSRTLIFDVRAPERYQGKLEPIDPRAGHVPGAVNAPVAGNLRAVNDTRFLSPHELRTRFAAFGADDAERIAAYCGSGINACQAIFALQHAGYENVLLYAGSWSDWSHDPNLPAAVGEQP